MVYHWQERILTDFLRGFVCYGVPIGSDKYVTHKLRQIAKLIAEEARKSAEILKVDRQSLWTVLRLSIANKCQYFCQLSHPSLVIPVAAWLDKELWSVLEAATGLTIPVGEEGRPVLRVPVDGLDKRSFQEWAIRLPVKLYGWGLRSMEDICRPAHIGALETSIPFMAGRGDICPQMEGMWGGQDCLGGRRHLLTQGGEIYSTLAVGRGLNSGQFGRIYGRKPESLVTG